MDKRTDDPIYAAQEAMRRGADLTPVLDEMWTGAATVIARTLLTGENELIVLELVRQLQFIEGMRRKVQIDADRGEAELIRERMTHE